MARPLKSGLDRSRRFVPSRWAGTLSVAETPQKKTGRIPVRQASVRHTRRSRLSSAARSLELPGRPRQRRQDERRKDGETMERRNWTAFVKLLVSLERRWRR